VHVRNGVWIVLKSAMKDVVEMWCVVCVSCLETCVGHIYTQNMTCLMCG